MIQQLYSLLNQLGAPIYPDNLPPNAADPAIVYSLTDDDPDHFMDARPTGSSFSHLQLEVIGSDHAVVDSLTQEIATLLDGWRGVLSTEGIAGFDSDSLGALNGYSLAVLGGDPIFVIIKRTAENSLSVKLPDGSGDWLYVRSQSFSLHWKNLPSTP